MTLDVPLSLAPMDAEPVSELPPAGEWQYEPKVDGFRCLIFRDGAKTHLQSHQQKPLGRYFPEVAAAALRLPRPLFVLDGELVIPDQPFDVLQLRIHPSASRVATLSVDHPAQYIAFDLLADAEGHSLLKMPFSERREALEQFFREIGSKSRRHFLLSKATRSPEVARTWLKRLGSGLDGIMVKRLDIPYRPGKRAMRKFKIWQTVDCVVGGLYFHSGGLVVEYLLMGLYDSEGKLHYVGRCGLGGMDGAEVAQILHSLIGGPGFTGRAPGAKNRWSGRAREFVPLRPRLVAEVSADHIESARFRHGSRLLRWRTDKAPEACTLDQITRGLGTPIK
jgi:ATP-dependent DNA ligase